jgi:hypothetical protein
MPHHAGNVKGELLHELRLLPGYPAIPGWVCHRRMNREGRLEAAGLVATVQHIAFA